MLSFEGAWQDILLVAKMKEAIPTLSQGVLNRIVEVTDRSITVVSERTEKERVLTKEMFRPYWEELVRKGSLNFVKDLKESDWIRRGAIIISFLAHLAYIEYSLNPRILYFMPEETHPLGTTKGRL
jgi:hypothetical protein